ncbi:MAG: aminomethyl-transferring glycine dehydrogenase [Acidobacteria bacterium]|nr:aminomethyl-transferring glycine dehydrogenase [Acidobacteriota bacterium]
MTVTQPTASGSLPFADRHIGPRAAEIEQMLEALGQSSLASLLDAAVPVAIRSDGPTGGLELPPPASEAEALVELDEIASSNQVLRSFIGMGYHGCVTPPVIQRNVLENPGWYTAYTPYQPEISQGRLEALLNFQTMVANLTGLEIANASLLDEPTAAAEAMSLCWADRRRQGRFFVSEGCHPQTIEVVRTRAEALGIEVEVGDHERLDPNGIFAALVQQPATDGGVHDYRLLAERVREAGGLVIAAADPLALCLLEAPGEWGADVAVGNTQRFGLPMGFGGPHAAYIAVRDRLKRRLPGRLVGVTHDDRHRPALRLALQTREQHIRRDRATSNICTAQVLPAVIASFYAVYHGPGGLRSIAEAVHRRACRLAERLRTLGFELEADTFFDTVTAKVDGLPEEQQVLAAAVRRKLNLRGWGSGAISVACDETTTDYDIESVLAAFAEVRSSSIQVAAGTPEPLPEALRRTTPCLEHPVFSSYRSETELLRYLHRLEARDLSLTTSMIPLGSCTMKLNATAEMMPITWRGFAHMHPYAPEDQTAGYRRLCADLEEWLARITGFSAVSLQPNAGSQGEYAGLLAIRSYHESRGEGARTVCLIPTSAHGTNPASAVLAGLKVEPVKCDDEGNIDLDDLRARADAHSEDLAALMVTYPSTHGVFEEAIREICAVVHNHGGQIYLDGANMNAQVGVCRPGEYGADVCHLNLHKTFCIPHGGGGPGMGPIAVASHLAPFLPRHPLASIGRSDSTGTLGDGTVGAVSAAPVGSGSILPISWAYIRMMGTAGLRSATEVAILNANYIAQRLAPHYPVLYRGAGGLVAHECILDLRDFKSSGVEVDDVAKRLIDYGFHAPTMSFPVAGTLMVEPTESESKAELDRFCDAMVAIRAEIAAVERGDVEIDDSPLRGAPHTAAAISADDWDRPYSRRQAAFPAPWTDDHKYWPPVGRIDNVHGDRHLICTCIGMEPFEAVGARGAFVR